MSLFIYCKKNEEKEKKIEHKWLKLVIIFYEMKNNLIDTTNYIIIVY